MKALLAFFKSRTCDPATGLLLPLNFSDLAEFLVVQASAGGVGGVVDLH
jgi:hypothetical protein